MKSEIRNPKQVRNPELLRNSRRKGFSLVEVLVGSAIFLIVAFAIYGAFVGLFKLADASQARILAVELADEQFETVRNMPYVNVGLTNGIPLGVLPQTQTISRGGFTFVVTLVVRNIDLATSTLQASSKLVEVDVDCPTCRSTFTPITLTGQISPANLQSAATGGALVVQVFDSNGVPIENANVTIQSTATSSVTDTDVTDKNGILNVIGVPPGVNVYRITVTKAGYSTARTYPPNGNGNPTPTSPDATVVQGQVTQVSLAIDKLSILNISSVSPLCAPVGSFHFNLIGAKQIGLNVPKYNQNLVTNSSGVLTLNPMEWDTYSVMPTDATYDINGMTPSSPFALNAGNTQSLQFVVVPANENSLMVNVTDSATGLPLLGASVELTREESYDKILVTGQGSFTQSDWSGGLGQTMYTSPNRYWADSGQVDVSTSTGNILLAQIFGSYLTNATATLESSTFDTGTTSNFYSLSWKPVNQPALSGTAPIAFQFATNPTSTSTVWNYVGPDGTSGSYFTVPGGQISNTNNGFEFARYKAYLSTQTATVTPIISDVSFTYTSGCLPPGQVIFQGLSAGTYTVNVSKSGYATWSGPATVGSGWQSVNVPLGL